MKIYVRCKSCGFIIEEGRLGEICPACGVPRKMFEPYTETVSEKRLRILDAHLHPIAVHLPQAYVITLIPLALAALAVEPWRPVLGDAVRVMAFGLPLVVLLAMLSGLLDGKTRFRRLSTPILKQKIVWGSAFLFFSLVALFGAASAAWPATGSWVLLLAAVFACAACSTVLARLGTSLLNARFPG